MVESISDDLIEEILPLSFPWDTTDPFLFCVHHEDNYPEGNSDFGPAASLAGRNLGNDFEGIDGWRMYHGTRVAGFPSHPHRGFETVTVVIRGVVDHCDSLGSAGRYGEGDVQWMTAGKGIVHSEMFPLVNQDEPNQAELFQIWLNLPAVDKMVEPHYSMFWNEDIPIRSVEDGRGRNIDIRLIAGSLGEQEPPSPPPNSWASRPESDLAIWIIRMDPDARWTVPASRPGTNRVLYFFEGSELKIGERQIPNYSGVWVKDEIDLPLRAGTEEVRILLLQGQPIGEPVVQHGPFVMNTAEEIMKTFEDYRRTRFGGWPWPRDDPVHVGRGRFAQHADGRIENKD